MVGKVQFDEELVRSSREFYLGEAFAKDRHSLSECRALNEGGDE